MPRPLSPLLQEAETLLERLSTFDPFEYSSSASTVPLHHGDGFTTIEEDWFMGFKLDREEAHRMHVLTKYAEGNSLLPWDNEYTDMAYDEEFLSQDALDQEMANFYEPSAPISQKLPSHDEADEGYAEENIKVESVEYQQPQKPVASTGSLERSGLTVEVVPYLRDVIDKAQTNTPYFKDSGVCIEDGSAAELDKPFTLFSANDGGTISWRPTENSNLGSSMFPDYENIDGQVYNTIDYEHPFATGSLGFPESFAEGMPDVVNHLHVLTHGDDPRQYEEIDEADMEEIMAQVDEEISARFPRNVVLVSDEVFDDNAAPDLQLFKDLHAHFEYEQGTATASAAVQASYPQPASHIVIPQENLYQTSPNGVHAIPHLELSASTIERTWQEMSNELDTGLRLPTTSGSNNQAINTEDPLSPVPQIQVPEDDLTPTSSRKKWTGVLDRSTAENPFPSIHIPETTDASTIKASGSIESQPSMATSNVFTTPEMDFTAVVVDTTSPDSQDLQANLQSSTSSPTNDPVASEDGYDGYTAASVFGREFSPVTTLRMQREVCNRLDALMPVSTLSQESDQPPQNRHEEENGATTIQTPGDPGTTASLPDQCMLQGSTDDLQHQGDVQFPAASVSPDHTGCNSMTDSLVNQVFTESSQQQNTEHTQTPTYHTSTSHTNGIMMSGSAINQESAQTPQDRNEEITQRPSVVPSAQYMVDASSPEFLVNDQLVPSSSIEQVAEVKPSTTFAGTHTALPSSPVNQTEDQDYHSTPPAWSPLSDGTNSEKRDNRNKENDPSWSMRNHPDIGQDDVFSDDLPSSITKEQGVLTGTPTFVPLAVDDEHVSLLPIFRLHCLLPKNTSKITITSCSP